MAVNETPPFWFEPAGLKAWLMAPFSLLYSRAAALAMHARPSGGVDVPVLCIGNFVAGGGGKTPTALALAETARRRGFTPGFLSRGYGGKISGPARVELEHHNAADVGDEPLLLARAATTVISSNRLSGAQQLVELGCDFIIMDDGFQNPRLRRDYNLVVVDSRRGIGNGFAIPAGPLRLDLKTQMMKADGVLVVGGDPGADPVIRRTAKGGKPVFLAKLNMIEPERWKGRALIAYAGIADPFKFFDSLGKAGAKLSLVQPFGDHHYFHDDEIKELINRAKLMGAGLVTTAKDMARLLNMGPEHQKLADISEVSEVELTFDDEATPARIIAKTVERFEACMLAK